MAGARLPDHSHCKFCGDPIPFGQEYCDDTCRERDRGRTDDEKRRERMFYGTAIAAIVILAVVRYIIA